jgi:succinate-semialdehyde dehydrogenase/glutarate-semialdehyde dehydrogenase
MALVSINPATGAHLATYDAHTPTQVAERLARAEHAFERWRGTPIAERAATLARVAELLERDTDAAAHLITAEMGKPLAEARAEVAKSAAGCRYYAAHASAFLRPETIATDAASSRVVFDPLGPVLAVMPWNFPFWQVFRFAAPALAAGNVGLLKHASNVTGTALLLERMLVQAGLPEGVFQTLMVGADAVPSIVADDRVRAVTLTGSEHAGASVAEAAGRALKKCVLELGGNDPFIVLADADVALAARHAVAARIVNAGQSCIAPKRFIVVDTVADAFRRAVVDGMRALTVGDPTRDDTDIGPLARADLRTEVLRHVTDSIAAGARLDCGGHALAGPGYFMAPTVLSEVRPGMPAFDEEVFGPVAAIVRARDEAEAVQLANRSRYGLGAAIWTHDVAHAEDMARRLDVGMVFVNAIVHSDPRLPFGGVKRSGYGRELSRFGMHEFVNARTMFTGRTGSD